MLGVMPEFLRISHMPGYAMNATPFIIGSILILTFSPFTAATAETNIVYHGDPIAPVILSVTGILFFALLGRFIARRLGQPSVLGELIVGILLGNILFYFGVDLVTILREGTAIFNMVEQTLQGLSLEQSARKVLEPDVSDSVISIMQGPQGTQLLQIAQTVDVFSRYGVIFLLFLVGLESSIEEMRKVSSDSLRVAVIGMLCPILLGFIATYLLIPELSVNADMFVAATLGATSVGITASVLKDLGRLQSNETNIILGAAVIDDILGLIILAIVTGIIVSGSVVFDEILSIVALSALFLISAFLLSPHLLKFAIYLVRYMDVAEAKLFISFIFVMILAWFANLVGLATIVGAYAAGLILHDAYFTHWGDHLHHRLSIKDLVAPLEAILVPIFFVLMGIQVKLEAFLNIDVIIIALVLMLVAIFGKLVSGKGARNGVNRWSVGIGMMPRGEVGLIFASIGKSLGVINADLFSAIVLMIIITTLITPPLLKYSFSREASA